MERRSLGRSGLALSLLGFGCGSNGGLMVRGEASEQERAVARAIELGIGYFDTAPTYGDGASERNLGRVLKQLKPDVLVGSKFRLPAESSDIAAAIQRSLEGSLARLGRDHVDLLQLHSRIAGDGRANSVAAATVLEQVVPALQKLRSAGKLRAIGLTGLGDTASLLEILDAGLFDAVQIACNLLNPSAGRPVPAGFPMQDFSQAIARAQAAGTGVLAIRVLAGGALAGPLRHPVASGRVEPFGTGRDYASDLGRATPLFDLVSAGHAGDLPEAAIRFAAMPEGVTSVLVGYSSLDQLERAAAAIAKGPLPAAAMTRLEEVWQHHFSPFS
jgi:aryl-alcohol dehydrogenase-like predicted oxidoreductase